MNNPVIQLAREIGTRKIVAFGSAALSILASHYPEFLFIGLMPSASEAEETQKACPQGVFWPYDASSIAPMPVFMGDALCVCELDLYPPVLAQVLVKARSAGGVVLLSDRPAPEVFALAQEHLPGFTFTRAEVPATVLVGRRVRA